MVDFRYHLVSLIAVFLALALGIILGAGPLQNSIGTALSDQVDSLRESREEARLELEAERARTTTYEQGIENLAPSMLSGTLADVRVAIIVLPGAESVDVDTQRTALELAGATVTGTVTLTDALVSSTNTELWAEAATTVKDNTVAGVLTDAGMADLAIIGTGLQTLLVDGPDAAQWLVDVYTGGDTQLMEINSAFTTGADAAIVVGPRAVDDSRDEEPAEDPTVPQVLTLLTGFSDFPLVVVGAGQDGSVVAETRASDASISTVDSPEDVTALLNGPLALTQELAGATVAWGLEDEADQIIGTRSDPALTGGEVEGEQ